MRKSVALLLVLVFLTASSLIVAKPAVSSADIAEDTWASKASMQQARAGLGVAVVNGKIYALGGSTLTGTPQHTTGGVVGTNEEYDPATDTWTYKKPMPTPREDFGIAVYQNKIYCISGGVNEVYDPATDTWETKTPMPTARSKLQANVVDGKIYLIGGDSNGTLNEVYDPATDSWTTKASMPTGAWSYASAVIDNEIYVIGGLSESGFGKMNQIYNSETDMWRQGAPSPAIVAYQAAGATTGVNAPKRIYVFGVDYSFPGGPCINRVYNPESDSWTFGADVPTDRESFGVAVVNELLYVIGGFTQAYSDMLSWSTGPYVTKYATNEQYTPFGYGTPDPSYDGTAPEITIASPENKTYYTADAGLNSTDIALDFTGDEPVFSVHFVLDGGTPVEISGNTTLSGLAIGAHNVTVFGFDASGNMGTSETVFFAIAEPEPFPVAPVVAASVATIAVVSVALLVYFKKRKISSSAIFN